MKFITAMLILGGTSLVHADTILQPGDHALYLVEHGQATSVRLARPRCPRGAQCSPSTVVKVELTLNGCLDRLGPVTAVAERVEDAIVIHMTAVGIHNEKSASVRCIRAPTETVDVPVPPRGFTVPELDNIELYLSDRNLNKSE